MMDRQRRSREVPGNEHAHGETVANPLCSLDFELRMVLRLSLLDPLTDRASASVLHVLVFDEGIVAKLSERSICVQSIARGKVLADGRWQFRPHRSPTLPASCEISASRFPLAADSRRRHLPR